jgi:hypothetical protein
MSKADFVARQRRDAIGTFLAERLQSSSMTPP